MPESNGSTYYVSPSGSDSAAGTSSAPWRTLEKAFAAVSAGTTIDLRGGTYPGEVVLQNRSFSSSNPVTIQNYPGETATFSGDPGKECYPAIYLGNSSGVRFRGLRVSNGIGNGFKIDNSADIEVDRSVIVNNGCEGIFVGGFTGSGVPRTYSTNVQIWNSTFSNNGGYFTGNESFAAKGDHSIYLGGGALDGTQHGIVGGVIANNVIYGQDTGYGIQLGMSAKNIIVTNNTIDSTSNTCCNDSAGNAIELYNDGSSAFPTGNVTIVNNLLTNNYAHGVYGACGASMTSNLVTNNLSYSNGMANYVSSYGTSCTLFSLGTNLPEGDPKYANQGAHDFHLQAGSAALGKADPAYTPPTDADGNARPAAPAVGAFG